MIGRPTQGRQTHTHPPNNLRTFAWSKPMAAEPEEEDDAGRPRAPLLLLALAVLLLLGVVGSWVGLVE